MTWFWGVVGLVLAVLLSTAWWIDRGVRRRGSRVLHHSQVWYDVRESRRDAELVNPFAGGEDYSWTSWSRRNRR
jgi:hypothetical protein